MLGGVKGMMVNAVVRHVKKMVPPFTLPDATNSTTRLQPGARCRFEAQLGARRHRLPAVHGRHHGRRERRNAHAPQPGRQHAAGRGVEPADRRYPAASRPLTIVTALPLYHIFALTACFLLGMRIGGMCILIPNPRDIPSLIKELSNYKVNIFPAVNTLYNALLNHPDFGKIDWSMLNCAIGGGMAVQKPVPTPG